MKILEISVHLALFVAVTALSDESLVKFMEQVRGTCLPKFPDLSEAYLEKVNSGFEPENPPTNLKCYLKCVFEYAGVLTKKGEIHKKKATAKLLLLAPEDMNNVATEAMDKCIDTQNSYKDTCDKVYFFSICVKHVDERLFIVP